MKFIEHKISALWLNDLMTVLYEQLIRHSLFTRYHINIIIVLIINDKTTVSFVIKLCTFGFHTNTAIYNRMNS